MAQDSKSPEIKIADPVEAIRQKYDTLLTVIIIVLFVGFVTLLITVFGLVIDAWNTKTVYYQNYMSQKSLSDQEQMLLQQFRAMNQTSTSTATSTLKNARVIK